MAKIVWLSEVSTSPKGWSTLKVRLDDGVEGEVFLGKEVKEHDLREGTEITYTKKESEYGLKLEIANFRSGRFKQAGGGFRGGGAPKDNTGMAVGAALNNAVTLAAGGIVKPEDIEKTARRILEISITLKKEFEGRI